MLTQTTRQLTGIIQWARSRPARTPRTNRPGSAVTTLNVMSDEKHDDVDAAKSADEERPADEERAHREQIEKTGEPKRDKLGNADGAS